MLHACLPRRPANAMLLALALLAAFPNPQAAEGAPSPARVQPLPVLLPATPAGQRLGALLLALDKGDPAALRALAADAFEAAERDPGFAATEAGELQRLHSMTGGLALRRIEQSDALGIQALAQGRATSAWYRLSLFTTARPPAFTEPAPPHKIVGWGIGTVSAPPELAETGLGDEAWRSRLDGLIDFLAAGDHFSGAVLVQRGGRTLYARAVGDADREHHVRNTLATRFNLASVTKMFTAVAVGRLVQAGKLQLSDRVGKLLPELAGTDLGRLVTVHQLLSHTAGVVGAREAIEQGLEPARTARTMAQMTASFINAPLAFRPGQQFGYSNAGYVLLGAIIERVSGQPYHDYVQRQVFDPAGMRDSCFCMPGRDVHRLATPYEDSPSGAKLAATARLPVIGTPANMAFSTAADMARFAKALYSGRLLRPELRERFWTGVTEQPDGVEYGYGARLERDGGRRVVWHGGGAPGTTNRFEMLPEEGLTLVVLSNVDTEPELIANKLREWLSSGAKTAAPVAPPPELALSVRPPDAAPRPGTETRLELVVSNRGGPAHAVIVDLEIKDAAGHKVEQLLVADQKLDTLQTRTFPFNWTPKEPGSFRIDAGVFGPGWRRKLLFEEGLAAVRVGP